MNIYKLSHRAACPNGGLLDVYKITVKSQTTILVEDIAKCLADAPKAIFQEDLADLLRNRLGAKIMVTGFHHGVKITTKRK